MSYRQPNRGVQRILWWYQICVWVGKEMDKELVGMLMDFGISVGILFLIFEGQIPGSYGITGVTVIMAFDISKAVEAYKRVQDDNKYQRVSNDH